jgi:hypothetical protein
MLPSASQLAAEDVPNPLYFLTSGKITIGRPAKKGGTTGKADILIFGEGSVSSVHCTLEVQPGQHGVVTITGLYNWSSRAAACSAMATI